MNAIPRQYRPAAEYQPGYDGLPVDGKQLPPNTRPCESRGERRSHSSGRRVVAASVLVSGRRPGCRKSDGKVPSPFPGKPLEYRPRSGSLNLERQFEITIDRHGTQATFAVARSGAGAAARVWPPNVASQDAATVQTAASRRGLPGRLRPTSLRAPPRNLPRIVISNTSSRQDYNKRSVIISRRPGRESGQALGRHRGRKGLRPSSRGGRARLAAGVKCLASRLPQVLPFSRKQALLAGGGRRAGPARHSYRLRSG